MATRTATTREAPKAREGLRKPQIRILKVLNKHSVSTQRLSEEAGVDPAWVADSLYGRMGDTEAKALSKPTTAGLAREKVMGRKTLLGLGYVRGKYTEIEVDARPEWLWEITAAGKKALSKNGQK